jgi:integrase
MSLCRPPGSKVWVMDFHFHGQRIRESTGMASITRAREVQQKRKQELRDGTAGIRKQQAPGLFSIAAEEYVTAKKWKSPRTRDIAENSLKHLLPVFGKKLLVDIEASEVAKYQVLRKAEGASGRTSNIEVGCLRAVMRKLRCWERIQPDVEMEEERDDVGYALSSEEESALITECGKSRSRVLLPFVVLAIETAARCGTIRRLQWRNVDFTNRCLTFGKDKTRAGSRRTIPLSQRAIEMLQFWAQQFPDRKPEHYVFLHERYAANGAEETFGFIAGTVYDSDPTRPTGAIKKAWEQARKRAALENVRIHDLRHTGVSRMIAAGTPLPIIGKITGWSAGTLVKMAARYGHFSIDEMRSAVESISGKREGIPQRYPQFSPQSSVEGKDKIQ